MGSYEGRGTNGMPIEELQSLIRDVPKPVIARVQGFAIGGGNVLCTICDLTICSDKAQFGQVGPKMGSVDPGYGTAFLARVVGEKKAREIWFLCRQYDGNRPDRSGKAKRFSLAKPRSQQKLPVAIQPRARHSLVERHLCRPLRDRIVAVGGFIQPNPPAIDAIQKVHVVRLAVVPSGFDHGL